MIYFPDNIPLPTVANTSDARASGLRVAETLAGVARVERSWGAPPIIKSLTWVLDRNQTALLYRFWKDELQSGSKEFEIKLDGPSAFAEPYRIRLLPGGWQSSTDSGVFSVVTMRGMMYENKKALVSFLYPFYVEETLTTLQTNVSLVDARYKRTINRSTAEDTTDATRVVGNIQTIALKRVVQRINVLDAAAPLRISGGIVNNSVILKRVVSRIGVVDSVDDVISANGRLLGMELNRIGRINKSEEDTTGIVKVTNTILEMTLGR